MSQYMTEAEKEDLALLGLANDKRKFAIAVDYFSPGTQNALERGIDHEWFRLVDVSFVAAAERPVVMRVFRLTEAGLRRLRRLRQLSH